MSWIVVRNWEKFQHYGDRRQPPWIKLYLALLHDDDFQSLSPTDRSALVHLWILYAMTGRRVREDTLKLTRATGQRFTKGTLERLNHAGFIEISASKPLALEVEVREEKRRTRDLLTELTASVASVENEEPRPPLPDSVKRWVENNRS
jgi:hypothetical protein